MSKRTGAHPNVRAGGSLAGNGRRPRPASAPSPRPAAPKAPERAAAKTGAAPEAASPALAVAPAAQPAAIGRPATKFGRPERTSGPHGPAPVASRGPTSAHGKESAARLFGDYSYVKQDLVRIAILTIAALICLVVISFVLPLWVH